MSGWLPQLGDFAQGVILMALKAPGLNFQNILNSLATQPSHFHFAVLSTVFYYILLAILNTAYLPLVPLGLVKPGMPNVNGGSFTCCSWGEEFFLFFFTLVLLLPLVVFVLLFLIGPVLGVADDGV